MSAVEADRVVVALLAETEQSTAAVRRYTSEFETGMARAGRAAGGIEKTADRASYAARNFGFQLSDIGQQVSGGTSPFIIIGQQAPQVLQALQDMSAAGATLGQTLKTIALPGLLAVATIAATLISSFLGGADSAKKKKEAVDALAEAEKRLAGASADANHATEQGILDDIRATEALRAREIQTRRQIQAELELAKSRLSAAQVTAKYNPGPEIPGRGVSSQQADIADLNKKIAEQNRKIGDANKAILTGKAELVMRGITAATNKAAAVTQKYEDTIDGLTRKFEAGKIGKTVFEQQALAATNARDAALKAISDTRSAQRSADREATTEARRAAAERAKLARELGENNLAGDLVRENQRLARGREDPHGPAGYKEVMKDIQDARKGRLDALGEGVDAHKAPRDQLSGYIDAIHDLNGSLRDVAADGLRSLTDGIADAIMGAASLGDAFKKVANQIISDLIRIAVEQAIVAPLAGALFGGGAGGLLTSLFGRASGGNVAGGHLYRVNEGSGRGVEGFVPPNGGGKIIPLGSMPAAARGGGTTIINQSFHLDARYGITTPELLGYVNDTAASAGRQAGAASFRASQAAAPGTLKQYSALKG